MSKGSDNKTPYRKNPDVVCSELDEGAILLNLNTKYYYNLNETALKIWNSVNGSSIISEIAQKIAEEYEVDKGLAEESVRRLLAELYKEGLVIAPCSVALE